MSFDTQSAQISAIRHIPASSKVKNAIVIIERVGYPNHDIVRTEASFLIDLKNSFLIGNEVTSMSHPAVRNVLRSLKGGTVTAKLDNVEAGSKYILDENSSEVKANPSLLGEERTRERSSALVERGEFLDLQRSVMQDTLAINAEAYASTLAAMLSTFSAPQANATATPTPAENTTAAAPAPAPAANAANVPVATV